MDNKTAAVIMLMDEISESVKRIEKVVLGQIGEVMGDTDKAAWTRMGAVMALGSVEKMLENIKLQVGVAAESQLKEYDIH